MVQRNVVVIGGSAGAVGAVAHLLAELPADFPASVFVALHLAAASGGDWLPAVFARSSKLTVETPLAAQPFEPGRVRIYGGLQSMCCFAVPLWRTAIG